MADISDTPKPADSKTWLWALVAIACVVGLMLWLAAQEAPVPPAPVTSTDTAAAGAPLGPDTTLADTMGVAQ
jgi:hypothetical protein